MAEWVTELLTPSQCAQALTTRRENLVESITILVNMVITNLYFPCVWLIGLEEEINEELMCSSNMIITSRYLGIISKGKVSCSPGTCKISCHLN